MQQPLIISIQFSLEQINTILQLLEQAPMPHQVSDPLIKSIKAQGQQQADAYDAQVKAAQEAQKPAPEAAPNDAEPAPEAANS